VTLHPDSRAFLAGQGAPSTWDLDAAAVAAGREGMRAGSGEAAVGPADRLPALAEVLDLVADGVPVRLFDPGGDAPRPVVVHVHGGGFVFGDLDTHDGLCRILAARTGAAVLAVDYRRAPEHPHPAAVDDVETAAAWLHRGGAGPAVDPDRMALLGDSAGGNVAAVVVRRARDAGGPPYACQVLVYPVIGASFDGPSWDAYGAGHGLGRDEMAFCWDAYVPDPADRRHPDVDPARAASLGGLPPALVITAECDPLRDDGERYAAQLAEAGVEAVATRYAGAVHGFWRRPAAFAASRAAIDQVTAYLRRCLLVDP
jgi:acetyl esterase